MKCSWGWSWLREIQVPVEIKVCIIVRFVCAAKMRCELTNTKTSSLCNRGIQSCCLLFCIESSMMMYINPTHTHTSAARQYKLTIRTLVMVNRASAPPCNQSVFAKLCPYTLFVTMPLGIVPNTNSRRYCQPKFPKLGVRLPLKDRK